MVRIFDKKTKKYIDLDYMISYCGDYCLYRNKEGKIIAANMNDLVIEKE